MSGRGFSRGGGGDRGGRGGGFRGKCPDMMCSARLFAGCVSAHGEADYIQRRWWKRWWTWWFRPTRFRTSRTCARLVSISSMTMYSADQRPFFLFNCGICSSLEPPYRGRIFPTPRRIRNVMHPNNPHQNPLFQRTNLSTEQNSNRKSRRDPWTYK